MLPDIAPAGISLRLRSLFLSSSSLRSSLISSLVLVVRFTGVATTSPPALSMLARDGLGLIVGALTLATSTLMVRL